MTASWTWVPVLAAVLSAGVGGALTVALLVLLPLLMREPDDRYPDTNTFVLRRMDTVMPILTVAAIAASVVSVFLAVSDQALAVVLHAAGATGLLALLTISAVVLHRINDTIAAGPDPSSLPPLRARWRGWHLTRVSAALTAAATNTAAALIVV
ncbi:hypothetical protein [Amycolatopsis sp. NPDC049868]|uniref:hypothetical protein n=1 Tax=Amycolatopsis sp. NPDC049868 TaxID=3363934 RepID=UPI0037AB5177